MHKLFFRVALQEEPTAFKFRGKFLHVEKTLTDSSALNFVEDSDGFLIWKSVECGEMAKQVYESLKSCEHLNEGILDFVSGSFLFVLFDAKKGLLCLGKDRLGLSSLIFSQDPLAIGTHDIDGEEQPPGFTILHEDTKSEIALPKFSRTVSPSDIAVDVAIDELTRILCQSVRPGVPVLFSGGLDSTLIAGCLGLVGAKQVDLINFCMSDNAPDRVSARESLGDLKRIFPSTNFSLHEFTGDIDEMSSKLLEIRELLKPSAVTEMNLNIAMTLYSSLSHVDGATAHSGLGADELFCGYMRMKTEASAEAEITEHVNRLWLRNGGRDDRVAMHLGKQCLFPFLSREFIEYALTLPMHFLIRSDLPRGQGEKWILRQLAVKIGLTAASIRPKQAMQFGSKVAKAKWRGTDVIPQS